MNFFFFFFCSESGFNKLAIVPPSVVATVGVADSRPAQNYQIPPSTLSKIHSAAQHSQISQDCTSTMKATFQNMNNLLICKTLVDSETTTKIDLHEATTIIPPQKYHTYKTELNNTDEDRLVDRFEETFFRCSNTHSPIWHSPKS